MQPTVFEALERTARQEGAAAAIRSLIDTLEAQGDFHRLFDALLLEARCELKLPMFAARRDEEMEAGPLRDAYEERVVAACHRVGTALLAKGEIPSAYRYFHAIGESEPIREAIDRYEPSSDPEEIAAVLEIAITQGVHPVRGLAMAIEQYGLCQAITTTEQLIGQGLDPKRRAQCVTILADRLHEELTARLRNAIDHKEGSDPGDRPIPDLLENRDWLFENDEYHVDASHLNAIVRMARVLESGPVIDKILELCEYGNRLSEKYRYPEAPPFEDVYADTRVFLMILDGRGVDEGLRHFREKAESAGASDALPAEILVHLLNRLGRLDEAIEMAGRYLNSNEARPVLCPTLNELCQESGRFDAMAEFARQRGDVVAFLAGLVQQSSKEKS